MAHCAPVAFKLVMLGGRILRATGIARALGKISFPMAMLASSAPSLGTRRYRATGDGARGTVALLNGCVMGSLFPHVHRATRRTLTMNGYTMVRARGAGCCGALHAHAGDAERAREFAREAIAAFERSGAELIAVNAAGCGAMMKEYGRLLADDPAWACARPRSRRACAT